MEKIIKNFKVSEDKLSYGETWRLLADLTAHIEQDNNLYHDGLLPQDIRERQLVSIKTLISHIEDCHELNKLQ